MWNKGEQYVTKMGGVILTASVIIWALGYFPRHLENTKVYDAKISQITDTYARQISQTNNVSEKQDLEKLQKFAIDDVRRSVEAERQKNSYIGRIGQFLEPVMAPLGFDWRMSVSLLSGVAAKEIIISTMGILYQVDNGNDVNQKLIQRLHESKYQSGDNKGQLIFTPMVALSFLSFVLLYFPCIAVITAIGRESGKWKIALFTAGYTTTLAWLFAFMIYQVGKLIF
jgi:ferrous iron transport protein B